MWVRSQNQDMLVNCCKIYVYGNKIFSKDYCGSNVELLGAYLDEDKARTVLKLIQEKMFNPTSMEYNSLFVMPSMY